MESKIFSPVSRTIASQSPSPIIHSDAYPTPDFGGTLPGQQDIERSWLNETKAEMLRLFRNLTSYRLEQRPGIQAFEGQDIVIDGQDRTSLRIGLGMLLRHTYMLPDQVSQDALDYATAVIVNPQDTVRRAQSAWIRSCSTLHHALMGRFGPAILDYAQRGCQAVISDHYGGDSSTIAHVNKKANFLRTRAGLHLGAEFHPASSPLAVGCYESGTLPCSLVLSAWMAPKDAVKYAAISHLSVCDDYGSFTIPDREVRIRMVAQAVGAAFEFGGQAVNSILDGTALQAVGHGNQVSVDAVLAWRAVSGCTTVYSGFIFGNESIEDGLVAPEVIMATHDLLDWRSDTAAGNLENGVSAMYGLGGFNSTSAFHTYLEEMLRRASQNPRSGMHAIAGMVYMHFTASRYGSYNYRGTHGKPCRSCIQLLQDATAKAGLAWAPKPPPASFAQGEKARQQGKLWVDKFEDHGLVQEAICWFQHLISTGKIWLFDAVEHSVSPVDLGTNWA